MINELKIPLIAPCGMNCGLCYAFQRTRNRCDGCKSTDLSGESYLKKCSIRNCILLKNGISNYCGTCEKFPCVRLRSLDKRYKSKYGMSMLENLNEIKTNGIQNFLKQEKIMWKCSSCGHTLCVHKQICLKCGKNRKIKKYEN